MVIASSYTSKIFPGLTAAIFSFFVFSFGCIAQDDEDTKLSASDKKTALDLVYEDCPDADVLEIESIENYIEVEYLCAGVFYEIGIASDKIIFREEDIAKADMDFAKIAKKINKEYPGYLIDEYSKITTADTSFIRVEIIKEGMERNIYFTPDGKWYKTKSDFTEGKWSEKYAKVFAESDNRYSLLNPDASFEMPDILREISGIAYIEGNQILGIQDELGVVFRYDLSEEKIVDTYRFTDVGDFEDLAVRGDTVSVLRSDGTIFEFDYADYNGKYRHYIVPTRSLDVEGLDFADGKMYLASKEPMPTGDPDERVIFSFSTGQPSSAQAFLTVRVSDIKDYFSAKFPDIPSDELRFNPSAVAVHPLTGELYVLSAKDGLLAIYRENELQAVYPLPEKLFYKPEGIDFSENGDLFISSEGDKKGMIKARIVKFTPK